MPLEVVCNNHSPALIYGGYATDRCVFWCLLRTWCCQFAALPLWGAICVCIVVLGAHLVLSCQCFLHFTYVLCFVVLGAHLVPSVLAALGICVGYMWCWERTYVLAICIMGCLACTWYKRGETLVKLQTFPISYGVMGHVRIDP